VWNVDLTLKEVSNEGEDILPFVAVRELLDGEKSGDCWQNLCNAVQDNVVLGAA
jgi:hypothetical protein